MKFSVNGILSQDYIEVEVDLMKPDSTEWEGPRVARINLRDLYEQAADMIDVESDRPLTRETQGSLYYSNNKFEVIKSLLENTDKYTLI